MPSVCRWRLLRPEPAERFRPGRPDGAIWQPREAAATPGRQTGRASGSRSSPARDQAAGASSQEDSPVIHASIHGRSAFHARQFETKSGKPMASLRVAVVEVAAHALGCDRRQPQTRSGRMAHRATSFDFFRSVLSESFVLSIGVAARNHKSSGPQSSPVSGSH